MLTVEDCLEGLLALCDDSQRIVGPGGVHYYINDTWDCQFIVDVAEQRLVIQIFIAQVHIARPARGVAVEQLVR